MWCYADGEVVTLHHPRQPSGQWRKNRNRGDHSTPRLLNLDLNGRSTPNFIANSVAIKISAISSKRTTRSTRMDIARWNHAPGSGSVHHLTPEGAMRAPDNSVRACSRSMLRPKFELSRRAKVSSRHWFRRFGAHCVTTSMVSPRCIQSYAELNRRYCDGISPSGGRRILFATESSGISKQPGAASISRCRSTKPGGRVNKAWSGWLPQPMSGPGA